MTPEQLEEIRARHAATTVDSGRYTDRFWDDAVQDVSALLAEVDRLKACNKAMREAFRRYVDDYGVEHDDPNVVDGYCPEDDTCQCPHILALNAAFSGEAS